jgi:hypothetical protein
MGAAAGAAVGVLTRVAVPRKAVAASKA